MYFQKVLAEPDPDPLVGGKNPLDPDPHQNFMGPQH
jgi:hypothetical protein